MSEDLAVMRSPIAKLPIPTVVDGIPCVIGDDCNTFGEPMVDVVDDYEEHTGITRAAARWSPDIGWRDYWAEWEYGEGDV